jgi:type III restriction enzyme
LNSHLNFVVADTKVWEQAAAYTIDKHPGVAAFAKNAGLGFSIPYLHNGQPHEYVPDFIIRLAGEPDRYLVLETKGFDELADIKAQAADRWVKAVNADGRFGTWRYAMARKPGDIAGILARAGDTRIKAV